MKMLKFALHRKMIHQSIACLLVFCMVNLPVWALNKDDAAVSAGAATKSQSGNTVSVDLITPRAVLDWTQMNATSAETLNFTGSSGFAVLNRVQSAVHFDGTLNGMGGHVFVISPNGVVIGPNAAITASAFTASGLNISNPNFMAGQYQFVPFQNGNTKQIGMVTNEGTINAHNAALLGSSVFNKGTVVSDGGLIVLAAGDEIYLGSSSSDVVVKLDAVPVSGATYNVTNDAVGRIESPRGTIVLAAGDTFAQAIGGLSTKTYTVNTRTVNQKGNAAAATVEIGAAGEAALRSGSTTTADEAIHIGAGKVRLEDTLTSDGALTIDADYGVNALAGITSQEAMKISADSVQVRGDVVSGETAAITADNLYSKGDITAQDDLLLDADTTLWGEQDQHIRSEASVKSAGTISKIQGGNLHLSAAEDVRLDGDVSAVEYGNKGGVSVIAETGKIHTGDGTDTLNVAITGYSNDITEDAGVPLPGGEGKAAIVLQSHDTLKLGADASLTAEGFYLSSDDDPFWGVDDRTSMDWLAEDGEFIGGHERDEGIASDVAIYIGSETGNVEVSTVHVQTAQPGSAERTDNQTEVVSGPATVVFDAYDTVTMPSVETVMDSRKGEGSENNFRNFRLEADSRITEWLYQAVENGTLPYASEPEAVKEMLEQDYVLRGAGLDNPAINDGRAWVLENPPAQAAAPLPARELPELEGCPVEMDAVANELGINSDDIQFLMHNALAANPNLQPCQACQRVMIAVGALRDEDGARFAAMNRIFNSIAPIDAPFTPEVSAAVTTALADMADSNPDYALAADYIDAFVDYVAVVNGQLKAPVGDPVVYTLNKYGQSLMSADNQNILSYLVARVEVIPDTAAEQP
ncbi:MAG: filamentous hemagglutinin N-terminal domain-containing protein [Planctomycetales bacterium]|nr:filamentous hemagglutinin N-terminal domain-containing protein [Planctomycetales bacterium]